MTKSPLYLAIDFGTSSVRCVAGRGTGKTFATARIPLRFTMPDGGPHTALEIPPAEAWHAVTAAVRNTVAACGSIAEEIKAISVTGQRFGIVLMDKQREAARICPNRDARAVFQGAALDETIGERLWDATGHGPAMLTGWAKLRWFKEEDPNTFAGLRHIVSIPDWICFRMTGNLLAERALAVESGMANVSTGDSNTDIGKLIGITEVGLPQICDAGEIIGYLTTEASSVLGIREGLPVVSAGPDTQAALIGMGAVSPRDIGIAVGWSGSAQMVLAYPARDYTNRAWSGRHVITKRWVLDANLAEMGGAYSWLGSLLYSDTDEADAMEKMNAEATRSLAAARGIWSRLDTPKVGALKPGMSYGGFRFPVPLSFEPPDKGALVRSVLESFAFELRRGIEHLEEKAGYARSISIAGGVTRSSLFIQILSAVIGRPLRVTSGGESAALGALSLAESACGSVSLENLALCRFGEASVLEQGLEDVLSYEDFYREWLDWQE